MNDRRYYSEIKTMHLTCHFTQMSTYSQLKDNFNREDFLTDDPELFLLVNKPAQKTALQLVCSKRGTRRVKTQTK